MTDPTKLIYPVEGKTTIYISDRQEYEAFLVCWVQNGDMLNGRLDNDADYSDWYLSYQHA